MYAGEHSPTLPLRVMSTVAFPAHGPSPSDREPRAQVRAGWCRDRYGDDVGYIELSGELDAFTASRIRDPLAGLVRFAGELVIDATKVSFIDSAGLRLLQDVSERVATNGHCVWLHNPSQTLTRLVELVGGDEMIPTCTPGNDSEHHCLAAPSPSISVSSAS